MPQISPMNWTFIILTFTFSMMTILMISNKMNIISSTKEKTKKKMKPYKW